MNTLHGTTDSISFSGAQSGRVPDFFLVGQPKTGTTALFRMLSNHPQIFMPMLKETHFLAPDLRRHSRVPRPGSAPDTFEEYLALFEMAKPEQHVGEASTTYMQSYVAAHKIKKLQPTARIIAILREPASLLRSLHLHLLKTRSETETSLRQAMCLEADRRLGRLIPPSAELPQQLLYSDHVRYVEQLQRYHRLFGKDHVLVLIYDDFRQSNAATVSEVLRFLDVDDSVSLDLVEANPTVGLLSPRLNDLVQAVTEPRGGISRRVNAGLKMLLPRPVRLRALQEIRSLFIYGAPVPADEPLMHDLRRRFKPEVVALSKYLNRDLVALWGYGGVE